MTVAQAELEAMIGRAEEMCERYRAAANVRSLNPRTIAARQDLRASKNTLARLRQQRGTTGGDQQGRGKA